MYHRQQLKWFTTKKNRMGKYIKQLFESFLQEHLASFFLFHFFFVVVFICSARDEILFCFFFFLFSSLYENWVETDFFLWVCDVFTSRTYAPSIARDKQKKKMRREKWETKESTKANWHWFQLWWVKEWTTRHFKEMLRNHRSLVTIKKKEFQIFCFSISLSSAFCPVFSSTSLFVYFFEQYCAQPTAYHRFDSLNILRKEKITKKNCFKTKIK